MIKKCSGCGSVLQHKEPKTVGYTPKENAKLCERCFKLKNYNQKEIINLKYNNEDILNILNNDSEVVFFITDFLNLNQETLELYKKIKKEKYLVINKIDYIPYSINLEKYKDYLLKTYDIKEKIIFVSALKNYNLNELNNKFLSYKKSYICGFTNSGKSTIINGICKMNGKDSLILESLMPNTTLDVIKIKLDGSIYIFDTPGFTLNGEFEIDTYPKKYIKPITIQTKENEIIQIGENKYIYSEQKNSFTFYMSQNIKIKKIYKDNIKFEYDYKINKNSDVIINNYGFINIKNECNIKTNFMVNEVRHSMFE